jgi:hypothetical protein
MKSNLTATGFKFLNKGKKKVFTRNGLDWTKRFSVIAGALILSGQAIIDGEVVVIKDGRTNIDCDDDDPLRSPEISKLLTGEQRPPEHR